MPQNCIGCNDATPNLVLEQLGNLMPIRERFSFLANNIANKIIANHFHSALSIIRELICKNIVKSMFVKSMSKKINEYNVLQISKHPALKNSYELCYFKAIIGIVHPMQEKSIT